jgi:hypothetical protein
VELPVVAVASTLCQVPVVVTFGDEGPYVDVAYADGRTVRQPGRHLSESDSVAIFGRTGEVRQVRVALTRS